MEDFTVAFCCGAIQTNLGDGMQWWKIQQKPYVDKAIWSCCRSYAEGKAGSEDESFLQEIKTTESESSKQALRVPSSHENIGGCDAVEQAGEQSKTPVLENYSTEGMQGDGAQQEEGAVSQGHSNQQPPPHTQPAAQGPQQRLCQAPEDDGEEGEKRKVVFVKISSLGNEEEVLSIPVREAAKQPLHHPVQVQGVLCPRGPERLGVMVRDSSVQDSLKRNIYHY